MGIVSTEMELILEKPNNVLVMKSRSILTDSQVTPTKHGRMTKPYSSPYFIANCFNAGYLKMERRSVKVKELQERCIIKGFQVIKSRKTYVPKWNVINDYSLDDPDVYRSMAYFSVEVRLRSKHNYKEMKKFKRKCNRQADLLKKKDTEIASLKAQLSLKKAKAAEVIRLRGQVAAIEAMKAARVNELNSLKKWITTLEGPVVTLEFATIIKDTELASSNAQITKLTQDLSNILSCDELSIKAASLESKKDKHTDQVSLLETTCFSLRDQVSGYGLFKEQIEVVQDEKVKLLSEKVAGLDAELMGMALHLYKEFYLCFLTTIVGRRWIIGAIGRAIDKGMQDGLAVVIDHGKPERGLVDVAAYNPSAEANYVFTVNAFRVVDC
uniref:Uncharacterized protein n=1 Tax=Tanacetum cinerariifolium TaxID=118510 RepID=A0A699H3G9_TANCI|nr:hypothetical protein [Tanacetum cinerariifolium]